MIQIKKSIIFCICSVIDTYPNLGRKRYIFSVQLDLKNFHLFSFPAVLILYDFRKQKQNEGKIKLHGEGKRKKHLIKYVSVPITVTLRDLTISCRTPRQITLVLNISKSPFVDTFWTIVFCICFLLTTQSSSFWSLHNSQPLAGGDKHTAIRSKPL
jgi:hypothetical protein